MNYSKHAEKIKEYMKNCNHAEKIDNPEKDILWHCPKCGYVQFAEECD